MRPLTVLPESIPREMKIYDRWLLWRLVRRASKHTKVPYQPNGNCASVTDPSTWGSFNKIIDCYQAGGFDGIGFVLGQGIGGVDYDGDVNEDPLKIPTYTERSPTKPNGLHYFFKYHGKSPRGRKKWPWEIYFKDRYFTVTGVRVSEAQSVVDTSTSQIYGLYEHLIASPEYASFEDRTDGLGLAADYTDAQIIEAIAGEDEQFAQLLEGNWQSRYASQSEADLAFCNLIAPYFDFDQCRMDGVFRASGLMRPKWDSKRGGSTYGAMTVERACMVEP